MAERSKEEKQFSEDLDRLLAGEELRPAEGAGEDYRATVEFARKLLSHRDGLSPHSREQLRSMLLSRLAEQEAKAVRRRQPWWGQLLHNPVWRTATVTVAIAALAMAVIWQSGMLGQPQGELAQRTPAPSPAPSPLLAPAAAPQPAIAPAPPRALEKRALDTSPVRMGQEVRVQLEFTNKGSQPLDLPRFPPALRIARSGTDQVVRSFPAGASSRQVQPSETVQYTLVWDQKDDSGQQVPPGTYSVLVEDPSLRAGALADEARQAFETVAEIVVQSR